jgi:hypothetical protein
MIKIPVPQDVSVTVVDDGVRAGHSASVPVVHPHVICDGCRCGIIGVRYKCGNCVDFDLCEACEAAGVHSENGHLFIKVRKPLFSYFPRHGPALPPLPSANNFAPFRRCGRRNNDVYANACHVVSAKNETEAAKQPVQPVASETASPQVSLATPATPTPAPTPTTIPDSVTSESPVCASAPLVDLPVSAPLQQNSPSPRSESVVSLTPLSSQATPIITAAELRGAYVCDLTYSDDTVVQPGNIEKQWRIRNPGPNAWPVGTKIAFVHGNLMGVAPSFDVPLLANEEGVVSVTLNVPERPGRYMSVWQLSLDDVSFGHRVWAAVVVNEFSVPTTTPISPPQSQPASQSVDNSDSSSVSSSTSHSSCEPLDEFVFIEHDQAASPKPDTTAIEVTEQRTPSEEPAFADMSELAESMMEDSVAADSAEAAKQAEAEAQAQAEAEAKIKVAQAEAEAQAAWERRQELEKIRLQEEEAQKAKTQSSTRVNQFLTKYAAPAPASPAPVALTPIAPALPPTPLSAEDKAMNTLISMGFGDRALNKRLLVKYNNNLERAVAELLEASDNDWAARRH